jgi:hypothetical protein
MQSYILVWLAVGQEKHDKDVSNTGWLRRTRVLGLLGLYRVFFHSCRWDDERHFFGLLLVCRRTVMYVRYSNLSFRDLGSWLFLWSRGVGEEKR